MSASVTPPDSRPCTEHTAEHARALLAAIVDSADDAILSKDLNGIIQSCNAAAERMFGYSAAELVGQSVRTLIPADRQHEEDEILARLKRGERLDHFETVRRRKDGTLVDISLTVSPVRDRAGTIIGASKIARDITARKRDAEELAAQQAWFRVTLSSIGDAVIASDPNGRVTFMNAVAQQLTVWPEAEAIGRPLHEVFKIINENTRQPVESPTTLVLKVGHVVGIANHTLLIGRDGRECPIADSAAPIRDADNRMLGVVLVFRDVSEDRAAERERQAVATERERLLEAERAARAEAERASRAKDEFVAMVSHELRTPLNAILGWTHLMMQDLSDEANVRRGLETIVRNTRLQAQLIADLLDISRIVSGKLSLDIQSVNLAAIAAEAIETVRPDAATKGVEIREQLDADAGTVAGDPARVQQMIWNLLSNAVKFTPADGHVDISVRRNGHLAEIVVSDTGAGIRADVLPYVFDRFHQADRTITRRFGGLGLGLSIVKHLVELHGGQVAAHSAGEERGATFTIALPISVEAREPQSASGARTEMQPAISLASMHVLIVEDEADTREFLRRLLENHGAVVTVASSAAEALTLFRDRAPDLLVSDIGLPDADGYELIRRIREGRREQGSMIPAIALTAYARPEDRTRALRAGYQTHVVKPVESSELLITIASFSGLIDPSRHDGLADH